MNKTYKRLEKILIDNLKSEMQGYKNALYDGEITKEEYSRYFSEESLREDIENILGGARKVGYLESEQTSEVIIFFS